MYIFLLESGNCKLYPTYHHVLVHIVELYKVVNPCRGFIIKTYYYSLVNVFCRLIVFIDLMVLFYCLFTSQRQTNRLCPNSKSIDYTKILIAKLKSMHCFSNVLLTLRKDWFSDKIPKNRLSISKKNFWGPNFRLRLTCPMGFGLDRRDEYSLCISLTQMNKSLSKLTNCKQQIKSKTTFNWL